MRNYELETQEIKKHVTYNITGRRNLVPRSHCSHPDRGRSGYDVDLRDFRETSGTQGTIYFGTSEPITERNFREFIDSASWFFSKAQHFGHTPAFEVRRKLYL